MYILNTVKLMEQGLLSAAENCSTNKSSMWSPV